MLNATIYWHLYYSALPIILSHTSPKNSHHHSHYHSIMYYNTPPPHTQTQTHTHTHTHHPPHSSPVMVTCPLRGGTHYMKVTTYASPFQPPFFRSLENLYCFDPYIWGKMRKMSYFDPYFLAKFGKMYLRPPFLALCSILSQPVVLSIPNRNPYENTPPPPPHPPPPPPPPPPPACPLLISNTVKWDYDLTGSNILWHHIHHCRI